MDMCKYTSLTRKEMLSIINCAKLCTLGTYNALANSISMVPMWYTFSFDNSQMNFYFFSPSKGEKMDNMSLTEDTSVSILIPFSKLTNKGHISILARGYESDIIDKCEITNIIHKFLNKYGHHSCLFSSNRNVDLTFFKVTVSCLSGRIYNY